MNKLLTLLAIFIGLSTEAATIDTISVKSDIKDVTVFFSGAQISRSMHINAKQGKHLFIIEKLPIELNAQSIQVENVANCKILSVKHQTKQKNAQKTKEEKDLEAQIEKLENDTKVLRNQSAVFELEEKLLLDNSILSKKDDGTSIAELKEAADFYRQRLNEIKQSKLNLYLENQKINTRIQDLYKQLNELTIEKQQTYSQILIALECQQDVKADMKDRKSVV